MGWIVAEISTRKSKTTPETHSFLVVFPQVWSSYSVLHIYDIWWCRWYTRTGRAKRWTYVTLVVLSCWSLVYSAVVSFPASFLCVASTCPSRSSIVFRPFTCYCLFSVLVCLLIISMCLQSNLTVLCPFVYICQYLPFSAKRPCLLRPFLWLFSHLFLSPPPPSPIPPVVDICFHQMFFFRIPSCRRHLSDDWQVLHRNNVHGCLRVYVWTVPYCNKVSQTLQHFIILSC